MVHGHVIRPYSHSLSDDERLYRPDTEREKDAKRDPGSLDCKCFSARKTFLTREESTSWKKPLTRKWKAAADQALKAAFPTTDSIYRHVYSEDLDPCKWRVSRSRKAATRPWPT